MQAVKVSLLALFAVAVFVAIVVLFTYRPNDAPGPTRIRAGDVSRHSVEMARYTIGSTVESRLRSLHAAPLAQPR